MESNPSDYYQARFWHLLRETRTHSYYLCRYSAEADSREKVINVLLAITSSTSIAAWAVWQKYPFVWAGAIALSQVITAAKSYIPYTDRIKATAALADTMNEIADECEKNWFSVSEGQLTTEEIHELCCAIKGKISSAEKRQLKGLVLPFKQRLLRYAECDADRYLTAHFHPESARG